MSRPDQHTYPHLRTGASQYPLKPADARQCYFCHRMVKDGPIVADDKSLCREHNIPSMLKYVVVGMRNTKARIARNMRTRRRPQ